MTDVLTLFDLPPVLADAPPAATLDERFAGFTVANPWVVDALERLAMLEYRRGATRVGVKYLVEILRWHYDRATSDPMSTFKVNNSYTSRLARVLVERRPELADVIELRELRS